MPRRGQPIAATARAFAFPLSWSVTVCAGVAILALCAAISGTIGYVDEKRIAVAERVAVEHAIRTNADLQRQLDRARDALPASGAQIETASAATEPKPTPTLAASAPTVIDRAPPSLIPALGQTDPRLPDLRLPDAPLSDPLAANVAGLLRQDAAKASDSYIARLWARIAARDAEEQLERLAADYAELVDERDRLRERVRELEQSLSQAPQDSPQPAKMPPDNSFGPSSVKPGAAIIAFPGSAAASEQTGRVYKNFNPPGSAPNYFSDESGAILGTHTSASRR